MTLDVLRVAGIELDDLQSGYQPQLVEVSWAGRVADAASAAGIAAAGLPLEYPERVGKEQTRSLATACHEAGAEGIMCRSASLARMGFFGVDRAARALGRGGDLHRGLSSGAGARAAA